jgi:hypothetical protein
MPKLQDIYQQMLQEQQQEQLSAQHKQDDELRNVGSMLQTSEFHHPPPEPPQMDDPEEELSILHLLGSDANDFELSIELGTEDRVDHRAGVPAAEMDTGWSEDAWQ